jgi:acyl-CoA synthetase (AMP-forming)/AMP-acid ligase II
VSDAQPPPPPRTMRDLLRERAADDAPGLHFEDETWSWRAHVQASLARAAWLLALRPTLARGARLPVGVLLDNVPEYSFLLAAAAFAGAAVVGINPTRRGAELARDIRHTDCALIVTERRHAGLLAGEDTGVPPERVFVVDAPGWREALASHVRFLAGQRDLGTKQAPRYVRVAASLPSTETNKILKRVLRRERWECADPVWLREADGGWRRLGADDVAALGARFRARGREAVLDT